jgi:hypothetical protein
MIYEFRATTAKPGAMRQVHEAMAAVLPAREQLSSPSGFWHSDIGSLNQYVQLWGYRDHAHRAEVRLAAASLPGWESVLDELAEVDELELWNLAPFSTELAPGEYGIYEMRTYYFVPGSMDKVLDIWADALPRRVHLSPVVGCWYSESGRLNRLRHVWAYRSLDERARLRAESLSIPGWPPMTREWRVHEESQVLIPAPYSGLR